MALDIDELRRHYTVIAAEVKERKRVKDYNVDSAGILKMAEALLAILAAEIAEADEEELEGADFDH